MKLRAPVRLILAIALLGLAPACANHPSHGTRDNVPSPQGRIYNPQTREYEWQTPGRPSTSPGADSTSRQPYR